MRTVTITGFTKLVWVMVLGVYVKGMAERCVDDKSFGVAWRCWVWVVWSLETEEHTDSQVRVDERDM